MSHKWSHFIRKGVNTKHIHSHITSYSHWRTKNYCPFQQNTICFPNRQRRQDGQATLRHHVNNAVLLETKILSVKLWRKMPHLTRKILIFFSQKIILETVTWSHAPYSSCIRAASPWPLSRHSQSMRRECGEKGCVLPPIILWVVNALFNTPWIKNLVLSL